MPTPLYHVYLSRASTTPDNWDTANEGDFTNAAGWIRFDCRKLRDTVVNKNKITETADHTTFAVNTGLLLQSITLEQCILTDTDSASKSSMSYNDVKEFILKSMLIVDAGASEGFTVYLHVYNPSGGGYYLKWMDGSGTMQSYLRIMITGYNFTLDNSGVYIGNITVVELTQ